MMSVLFPDSEQTELLCPQGTMVESSCFCVNTSLEVGRGRGSLHDMSTGDILHGVTPIVDLFGASGASIGEGAGKQRRGGRQRLW